ncbi:hypothetical protein [Aliarcobacter lanthieri]|uniref:hypothetical protein n=1 Tax=Aliarcobacter lanthieri TaxID=1355374 RepID=UPI00047B0136|nr:hypothetical protein [Aliarcobacter lanthieri]
MRYIHTSEKTLNDIKEKGISKIDDLDKNLLPQPWREWAEKNNLIVSVLELGTITFTPNLPKDN